MSSSAEGLKRGDVGDLRREGEQLFQREGKGNLPAMIGGIECPLELMVIKLK